MSNKNNKSVSQALLDLESIRGQIKEESKNTLKSLLAETVKDVIREEAEDDDDMEIEKGEEKDEKKDDGKKKSIEEIGEDENELQQQPEAPAEGEGEVAPQEQPEAPAEGEASEEPASDALEAPQDGEGEDDEWSNFSQYQVSPNTYDFTNVSPDDKEGLDQVYKVYKLMTDDDQIVVKQEGDAIKLKDNAAGTEYVIDLGEDDEAAEAPAEGEEEQPMSEGRLMEGLYELDLDDNDEDIDDEDEDDLDNIAGLSDEESYNENKQPRKTMRENREFELVLEDEIHDYTDNYQDVDPIAGLSDAEPSKSGKSWEKGVPTGTKKPWAGDSKSKGQPFGKKVNEEDENLEEGAKTVSSQSVAKTTHTPTSEPRANNARQKAKLVHANGEYKEGLGESYKKVVADLVAENKKLKAMLESKKAENKELKETVLKVRQGLHENRVTTVNLAKITKLFVENAVSQSEKASIINRFSNEAKTIEQSKALYESINKELKKGSSNGINLNEGSMTVNGSKAINESVAPKSKDLMDTLDFIKRMENC